MNIKSIRHSLKMSPEEMVVDAMAALGCALESRSPQRTAHIAHDEGPCITAQAQPVVQSAAGSLTRACARDAGSR